MEGPILKFLDLLGTGPIHAPAVPGTRLTLHPLSCAPAAALGLRGLASLRRSTWNASRGMQWLHYTFSADGVNP